MAQSAGQGRDGERVDVTITSARGHTLSGQLVELSARSVNLALTGGTSRELEPGERVNFVLTGDLVGGTHEAEGNVIAWRKEGDGIICVIRYRIQDDYARLLATGVGRRFNRRGSFRVATGQHGHVTVTLSGSFGEATARAIDISATGMGLRLTDEGELPKGEMASMVVNLPDESTPVVLEATICHVRDTGEFVLYGVDYSEARSRAMELAVERIEVYVMRRQREDLRRKS